VLPDIRTYGPIGDEHEELKKNAVIMSVVEYECMRLMDYEGLTQSEAAQAMGVARSSVQRTYESVRSKIACCLIEGKPLRIEGGDFRLCHDIQELPRCKNCTPGRRRRGRR